jgi:predicted O-methyltransferase YrrM
MASSSADEVLRRIEETAWGRYLPIIGPVRGRILTDLVRRHRPRRVLEVGTFIGYSTILMGRELDGDSEIVTIEIDRREAEEARENIRRAEIKPRVRVLIGDALRIIPGLEGGFDLVFLDAAKGQYLDYLRLVEDKLRRGGVVAADNAGFLSYSMRDYLDYVRNSGRYESRFIPGGGDGVEVSIKL